MPIFEISSDHSLGFSHSGEVTVSGDGTVELTDEEVRQLVDLIKENDGETDVEELELEDLYPDIYETLDEACRQVAFDAEYEHWVIEGYEGGYYEDPDDLDERLAKLGYKCRVDKKDFLDEDGELDEYSYEDAKSEDLEKWIEEKRSTVENEASFLANLFDICPEIDGVDYEVEIPEAIVEMAYKEMGK